MGLGTNKGGGSIDVTIVGGKLRQRVEEGTAGASERTWEKKDGTKGSCLELVHDFLDGTVSNMEFVESPFGKMLNITIDGIVIAINTKSKYFPTFASRVPNIDFSKPITIIPYDFEPEPKDRKTGICVRQGGVKLGSAFYNSKTKESLLGMPSCDAAKIEDDDERSEAWQHYFNVTVKNFHVRYIKEMDMSVIEGNRKGTAEDLEFAKDLHAVKPQVKLGEDGLEAPVV